jgi:uncharacterized protein (DUF1330 family)
MSALLITVARFRQGGDEALRQYVTGVIPLIRAAGGEVISRGRPLETVVGDAGALPDLVAVMRFPDAAMIRGFLDSHAYRAHVTYRNEAFEDIRSYIADELMPASAENL